MGIPTRLTEDPTSAALNTAAHASEHCAVDRESLRLLGSAVGRQVLVRTPSSRRLALYTVVERVDDASSAVHAGTAGLARVQPATGEPPPAELEATVERDFTGGDSGSSVRLTEQLRGRSAARGLAILAPHGGRIELGTDGQARAVHRLLASEAKPVRAWIAEGFNPAGAHRCWHITATEISEHSFPRLGSLFGRGEPRGSFAHAIAFHGQDDSPAVVVGGGLPRSRAHTALKAKLSERIQAALRAVTDDPPPVVVRRFGPLAGAQQSNIVNRVTAAGNGIQLEQPGAVRTDTKQRDAIAEAVAVFYADLV
jgi:phage replication-related protein YjqB (UPF0714/DUF867 family)